MIVIKQNEQGKKNIVIKQNVAAHTKSNTRYNEWYGYNSSLFSFEES